MHALAVYARMSAWPRVENRELLVIDFILEMIIASETTYSSNRMNVNVRAYCLARQTAGAGDGACDNRHTIPECVLLQCFISVYLTNFQGYLFVFTFSCLTNISCLESKSAAGQFQNDREKVKNKNNKFDDMCVLCLCTQSNYSNNERSRAGSTAV